MQVNQSMVHLVVVGLFFWFIFFFSFWNTLSNIYAFIIGISRRPGAGTSQGEFPNPYGSGGG